MANRAALLRFLRARGFADARLCTYVDASVTPENALIVASALDEGFVGDFARWA